MRATGQRKATAIAHATGAVRNGAAYRMRGARAWQAMLAVACMAFGAMGASGACAAERQAAGGLVRFSGALVDRYEVTLVAPSGAVRHDARGASADVTFDAHDRRLPGARVVLADAHGAPLRLREGAGIRATW